ncbi:MAG: DUF1934 domain-containing protein [Clostridia bacterium]|nr:DUF1934 domain-containing protein [Clostridia bacterium]
MKDITLKITGKQVIDSREEDQMEFVTDGKLYLKNDAIYVIYEESEISGFKGCKTTLKIKDDSVKMRRMAADSFGTELYFEEGQRFQSHYNTPYGIFGVEILTDRLDNAMDKETLEGTVDISYKVSLEGMSEGKNTLRIDVK